MIEFLLRRYHTIDFMKDMDINTFVGFYKVAIEKDRNDRLYKQWCAMLPQLTKYMGFEQFVDKLTGRNIDTRSVDDIMADIEETHKKAKEHKDGS